MTKEILKEKIREVSIAKTYEEYVDALAEHLAAEDCTQCKHFVGCERCSEKTCNRFERKET